MKLAGVDGYQLLLTKTEQLQLWLPSVEMVDGSR
jgi:hypothetical protein